MGSLDGFCTRRERRLALLLLSLLWFGYKTSNTEQKAVPRN